MRTTIDLPDPTFRQAKVFAAAHGVTLKQFFTEALEEKLRRCAGETLDGEEEALWMAGFGALAGLSNENRRVLGLIEEEFETLAPEDLT